MTDRSKLDSNPRLGMRQQQKIAPGHFLGHRLLPINNYSLSLSSAPIVFHSTKLYFHFLFVAFFGNYFIGECCPFYCQSHLRIFSLALSKTILANWHFSEHIWHCNALGHCSKSIWHCTGWTVLCCNTLTVTELLKNTQTVEVEGLAITIKLCCYLLPFLCSTIFTVAGPKASKFSQRGAKSNWMASNEAAVKYDSYRTLQLWQLEPANGMQLAKASAWASPKQRLKEFWVVG